MRKYRERRRSRRAGFILICTGLLAITGITGAGFVLLNTFGLGGIQPNMEVIPFREYHQIRGTPIILDGEFSPYEPYIRDGQVFLPVDFLTFPGPHLYWESQLNLLTITTLEELTRVNLITGEAFTNFAPINWTVEIPVIGGMAHLPMDFVRENFDLNLHLSPENILVVDNTNNRSISHSVLAEEGIIRHQPDILSPIVEKISRGTTLHAFPVEGEIIDPETEIRTVGIIGEAENFTRVRIQNGAFGFIANEELSDADITEGFTRQPLPARNHLNEPAIIAWDLLTNPAASYTPASRTLHRGVNVLAPKWLRFERTHYSGALENISSADYVNWAHNNGMQVWPLLFDYQDPQVLNLIFSQSHLRDNVINDLMRIAAAYNFDGIMIDIEGTNAGNQMYFLQFLRELSPIMREHGLIFSVAVFVPAPWRQYYNHAEVGRVVDYVAVMAYDEHGAFIANLHEDATVGPNASIGFVRNAVEYLVNVMDSNQIILGLPFYTRIWEIRQNEYGQNHYTDRAVGIQLGQNIFANAGAPLIWNEHYGSYFATFATAENGQDVVTLAWVETERSLALKTALVNEHNLAGVAGWRRGLETPGVWTTIYNTIHR